jgi:hypothetical protein
MIDLCRILPAYDIEIRVSRRPQGRRDLMSVTTVRVAYAGAVATSSSTSKPTRSTWGCNTETSKP